MKPPVFPNAPADYSQQQMAALLRILTQYFNALDAEATAQAASLSAVIQSENAISSNVLVASGHNGLTISPFVILDGFSVTVADGSVWEII